MNDHLYKVDGSFLKGFFKTCSEHNLGEDDVVELFRQQTVAGFLEDPHVSRGFFNQLNKRASEFQTGNLLRIMTPQALAKAFLGPVL